jgi:hypothetical protein
MITAKHGVDSLYELGIIRLVNTTYIHPKV